MNLYLQKNKVFDRMEEGRAVLCAEYYTDYKYENLDIDELWSIIKTACENYENSEIVKRVKAKPSYIPETYDVPCRFKVTDIIDSKETTIYTGWMKDGYDKIREKFDDPIKKDLGTFTVDVRLMGNGKYDIYFDNERDFYEHYKNVTADWIGERLAGDIKFYTKLYLEEEEEKLEA